MCAISKPSMLLNQEYVTCYHHNALVAKMAIFSGSNVYSLLNTHPFNGPFFRDHRVSRYQKGKNQSGIY